VTALVRKRRRTVPRRRAATALRQGACLFSCLADCDPLVVPVGLRGHDDIDAVLICARHLPHLRQLRPYEAERLASYLHVAFVSHQQSRVSAVG